MLKVILFSFWFCIHCHQSLLLFHTHIYIFFGKSRLLRLAILLPERKTKRQLKLYLKERKDIFFIFFLFFLIFIILSIAWVDGPLWPAHPCCNLNCCFVFWYVVLWIVASLSCSTEKFLLLLLFADPSRVLFFLMGGTVSFRNIFLDSPEFHCDMMILGLLLTFFFSLMNTSSIEVLTKGFFSFVVKQDEELSNSASAPHPPQLQKMSWWEACYRPRCINAKITFL